MLRRHGHPVCGSMRGRAHALRDVLGTGHDPRESRFWTLIAVLNPSVARSPASVAWSWLTDGLRILAEEPEQ